MKKLQIVPIIARLELDQLTCLGPCKTVKVIRVTVDSNSIQVKASGGESFCCSKPEAHHDQAAFELVIPHDITLVRLPAHVPGRRGSLELERVCAFEHIFQCSLVVAIAVVAE